MSQRHTRILLVTSPSSDTQIVRLMLEESWGDRFTITQVHNLSDAVHHLSQDKSDVAIVDLGLEGAAKLDIILHLREAVPNIPVIVLTDDDCEEMAVRALQVGAQDYILKGQLVGKRLTQAIRYAITRQQQIRTYKTEACTDPLTNTLRPSRKHRLASNGHLFHPISRCSQ